MVRLKDAVPWGRNFDEYCRMFGLHPDRWPGRVLGCSDGPASFNAEARRRGLEVVSVDPLYVFSPAQIERRIEEAANQVIALTESQAETFLWTEFRDVDALAAARRKAMRLFVRDFAARQREGRYVAAQLPALPFRDGSFHLALCSHFLFLYSDQRSEAFHMRSLEELARCAEEVRVYPLLQLGGAPSPHVPRVRAELEQRGYATELMPTAYRFQRGAEHVLRVRACDRGSRVESGRTE